jgi:RNA polymerase sigma-70 factor (ECF subfamily)
VQVDDRMNGSARTVHRERASATSGTDLEAFYAAHFPGLVVQLHAYVGDLGVAHELVQEAICRAIPRWAQISGYDDPLTWVRRAAFNLAKSRWRRMRLASTYQRKHQQLAVPEPSPDRVALITALAKLPTAQRRAIVLHYLADLPVAAVATSENVPEGTIRVRLHRARTALATLLSDASDSPRGESHA